LLLIHANHWLRKLKRSPSKCIIAIWLLKSQLSWVGLLRNLSSFCLYFWLLCNRLAILMMVVLDRSESLQSETTVNWWPACWTKLGFSFTHKSREAISSHFKEINWMHLKKIKAVPLLSIIALINMWGASCKADERWRLNKFCLKIVRWSI
jgi:hypothetical protein